MASATATATMAAAGFDVRPSTGSSSLQTPRSGGLPSEMRSPLAGSPSFLKQRNDELKTPITPPSAYLDFLKNMSPALMSPAPTSTSARFSFHGDKTDRWSDKASETATEKPSISPPTSQPALSRNTSYDSNTSTATSSSTQSIASSVPSATGTRRQRPESPRVTIPPSPFAKPALRSARTPRKLTIPQSPYSTGLPSAGMPSARSVGTPYTSTPLSAAPWSASFSSRDVDVETTGKPGKVTVKQVVTRTVTYCRTPLEAIPDGNLWKRRKVEHEGTLKGLEEYEPTIKEEGTDSEGTAEIRTVIPEAERKTGSGAADEANIDPALKDA
ncbi:hypothetical protein LTR78_002351 [Recurvomyces mirabilis]|uniref:Uncharacterized protein n=1 Tax=Recurvomyces mirabilis TaxID=574656 RepID=A0AAE0WTI8_9PEZI|nr:hypothetical protein LTR78_002351 [Recurvomyces mirabilis]KAK5157280.1 hypothetical protein LTS14_004045 [Recurvomyces mirabilis]